MTIQLLKKLPALKLPALSELLFLCVSLVLALPTHATVVEVRTVAGDFQINLFDETTPQNVENLLSYINAGAYSNNVVHRSVPGFIVQMGGFQYGNAFPPDAIPTGAGVTNEPVLSNLRGTVAMAKLAGNPDSATSQFFINLSDNSANLDAQNGGFTVLGQVIGDGMEVVDAIAAMSRFNFGGAFAEIPLRDYASTNTEQPTDDNLVIITDVVVIDAAVVTNPDLNPAQNTLANPSTPSNSVPDTSLNTGGSSGGALGFSALFGLGLLLWRRRVV
ncbi:MAG: peptidylprolyl isomerase [Glaciecola sp.]|nr:peptidylprolyl isomerase [Glaciecola sp.]MDG1815502.1 peptidylprolyl isomerase [Glaciecola sp.]MDG2099784.1 peptidylprolyl isomerase [Glaciecola sp.]